LIQPVSLSKSSIRLGTGLLVAAGLPETKMAA
jgi:hypothetical protein